MKSESFIKDVIHQGGSGGLLKDEFTYKAYLVKVMTEGEGGSKFDDVF